MENAQKKLSDKFWITHFNQWLGVPITQTHALQVDFWDKLRSTLEASDEETIKAVMLSTPAIRISSGEMYLKIVQIAKGEWNRKHFRTDEIIAKRRKELGLD